MIALSFCDSVMARERSVSRRWTLGCILRIKYQNLHRICISESKREEPDAAKVLFIIFRLKTPWSQNNRASYAESFRIKLLAASGSFLFVRERLFHADEEVPIEKLKFLSCKNQNIKKLTIV